MQSRTKYQTICFDEESFILQEKRCKIKKKNNYSKTNSGKKLRIPNLDVGNCSQKVNELVNFELFRLHNLSLKISNSWELRKID